MLPWRRRWRSNAPCRRHARWAGTSSRRRRTSCGSKPPTPRCCSASRTTSSCASRRGRRQRGRRALAVARRRQRLRRQREARARLPRAPVGQRHSVARMQRLACRDRGAPHRDHSRHDARRQCTDRARPQRRSVHWRPPIRAHCPPPTAPTERPDLRLRLSHAARSPQSVDARGRGWRHAAPASDGRLRLAALQPGARGGRSAGCARMSALPDDVLRGAARGLALDPHRARRRHACSPSSTTSPSTSPSTPATSPRCGSACGRGWWSRARRSRCARSTGCARPCKRGEPFASPVALLDHLLRDQADELQRIVRTATERVDEIEDELLPAGTDTHAAPTWRACAG